MCTVCTVPHESFAVDNVDERCRKTVLWGLWCQQWNIISLSHQYFGALGATLLVQTAAVQSTFCRKSQLQKFGKKFCCKSLVDEIGAHLSCLQIIQAEKCGIYC